MVSDQTFLWEYTVFVQHFFGKYSLWSKFLGKYSLWSNFSWKIQSLIKFSLENTVFDQIFLGKYSLWSNNFPILFLKNKPSLISISAIFPWKYRVFAQIFPGGIPLGSSLSSDFKRRNSPAASLIRLNSIQNACTSINMSWNIELY